MPEAPDLEVIREYLTERMVGKPILRANVLRPTVLRSLAGEFEHGVAGLTLESIERRGKYLLLWLSAGRCLAVNPMLTGAFQYCDEGTRILKRSCIVLVLENKKELRYLDDRQMGRVYFIKGEQLGEVPRLLDQGPDVLSGVSYEEFAVRLKGFRGEIKGVLSRGSWISGIGNAYSDEILFAAGISPFRKAGSLSREEVRSLYDQSRNVLESAIEELRGRVGDAIHVKIRDFLKVHNKGGEACPNCGGNISQLTANQHITSYCRRCQPGMLISN